MITPRESIVLIARCKVWTRAHEQYFHANSSDGKKRMKEEQWRGH